MSGLNQRGPMNDGPMTGRGRGFCTGNVAAGQGFVGGYGMVRGLRRSCRYFGWGGGQGMGRFRNYGSWAGSSPAFSDQTILQNRAAMLEAELAEIKSQLNKRSESGE
ncbi:MAG: DUF5320 domain-containing protein [Desulfobacteraceae bacterium]|nr:DUF5320 domain-containing protein [Desulfobacteraceae bacterium]